MKSVHSSKAAPYRQPVEQSRGRIIVWLRAEDLLLRTRETDKKHNTICLNAGEDPSFPAPILQSFMCVPSSTDNSSITRGALVFFFFL